MYEFWYDYIKRKYQSNAKLCYTDTDRFVFHIKTEDFYKDIAEDVKNRYNISNYEVNRPLPKAMNKNVIGLMKDELGGMIITKFVNLRPKTYSYLTDNGKNVKKAKGTKKYVIKRILKFDYYTCCLRLCCLFKDETILKLQQRFKSKGHCVNTEEVNKIALNSNDGKILQTFDRIRTYPYVTNALRMYKNEMLSKYI